MEPTELDYNDISEPSHAYSQLRYSPIKQEALNSNRGSSYDIEECMRNMNSMSNVNPRFAVEIDAYSIQNSRN